MVRADDAARDDIAVAIAAYDRRAVALDAHDPRSRVRNERSCIDDLGTPERAQQPTNPTNDSEQTTSAWILMSRRKAGLVPSGLCGASRDAAVQGSAAVCSATHALSCRRRPRKHRDPGMALRVLDIHLHRRRRKVHSFHL